MTSRELHDRSDIKPIFVLLHEYVENLLAALDSQEILAS
jgi:hypothetical protein